jgi:hypothetical protein
MAEAKLSDDVMNALVENSKVIDANTKVLVSMSEEKDKKETSNKNIVPKKKVDSSLTSDEKTRYANIGKELFAPVLKSLEKLLKKEKKKNEMTITNESETVEKAVKVQYEEKPKEDNNRTSWITILLGILAVAGIAVYMFKDKIVEFFDNAWTWIKDMFGSIGKFFDFSNENNPISKILNSMGTGISVTWELVKKTFTALGKLGSVIWDGIKTGWDKFITGPDGILNFGVKIIKGIISFAEDAVSWIGDSISSAIIDPLKNIFGGAKDSGKQAGVEAAKDVKASVNQTAADQAAKQKAITEDVIYSSKKADAAIIETAKATREDAKKRAKEQGLKLDKDGKVANDSLRESAAKAGLEAFMKANGINRKDIDDKKYKALENEFKKHVVINGKEAKINMEKLKEGLKEQADKQANWIAPDGPFINALQDLDDDDGAEKMNQINGAVTGALQQGLQITADMEAAKNLENMSEEERFEARMREAIAAGKSAEFRFMEGRQMILQSVETIKAAFNGYDETIRKNFTETWKSFMTDFIDHLKIEISTVSPQDNSKNTYHITPLNRESFKSMNDSMLKLATINTKTIIAQNKILEKIKVLLEEPPPQKITIASQPSNNIKDAKEDGVNYVAKGASKLASELFLAVT